MSTGAVALGGSVARAPCSLRDRVF